MAAVAILDVDKLLLFLYYLTDRHLEFLQLCISDVVDMFQVEIAILVAIGSKEMAVVYEIQDGGGRHL